MEEFKDFDENIKNKLSEQEFPFDESNWEKAAKMIDDSRKPKKRYGWIIIASLLFVGTSVLLYNSFNDNGKTSEKEIALSSGDKNQDAGDKNQGIKESEGTKGTKGTKGTEETQDARAKTQDNKTQDGNLKIEEAQGIKETKGTEDSGAETQDNKTQDVKVETQGTQGIKETGTKTQTVGQNETLIPKTEKKNKSLKGENTNALALNNTVETKTTKGKVSASVEKKKTNNKKAEEKQIASTKNNETSKPTGDSEKNKNDKYAKELISNKDVSGNQIEGTTNPSVTVNINAKPDSVIKPVEKTVASAPLDSAGRTDSVKTVVEAKQEPKKDETKSEPFYKNLISIEAGASYLLGWQNSGSTEGNGFNPVGGVNYSHFFSKKIGVSVGLQYTSVSNFINNTTLTKDSVGTLITGGNVSANTHYDFGVQNDIQIINVTKLHYLVLPIKIQYQLKKNIFGVGCNLTAIFNSDNSVETYTEKNNSGGQHSITKTSGYYVDAYYTSNIQLGAFYRRKLFKDLSVNAEFFYGLSDVKNNTFFHSNTTERNVGFKLTLCYDLFKK